MGYAGEHYSIKLHDIENKRWRKFQTLIKPICEIQLKSSLNHSYDKITHQLTYKNEGLFDNEILRTINTIRSRLETIEQDVNRIRQIHSRKEELMDREENSVREMDIAILESQRRRDILNDGRNLI